MKTLKAALFSSLLMWIAVSAQATVIVTYAEKPGAVNSSFINATTFDFNNLSLGIHKDVVWDGVGTFDQLNILKADQYGGANNTNYSVQGVGSTVKQTILNLDEASSYLGLWWSAGDGSNVVDFYSGENGTGTLIAEFTTANLLKALPKAYYGNPTTGGNYGKDAGEPFAYINFFATEGSSWSSIVFRNSSSSGLESDNYSSRVEVYDPTVDGPMPGVVFEAINGKQEVALAPEASTTLAMFLLGGLTFGGPLFRRFKKSA